MSRIHRVRKTQNQKTKNRKTVMKNMFVVITMSVLLMGCTVIQPPVTPASYGYGNGYGNGAVRTSSGRLFGLIPYTSTSWSATYTTPVYVAPPVDVYYSYPSYSA